MPKKQPKLQVYVVSVDFNSKVKRKSPYYRLGKLLNSMGQVVTTTHQIKLLLTWLGAKDVRDRILRISDPRRDRIYVGRITRGSAWHRLLAVSNKQLKDVLRAYAGGAAPTKAQFIAARKSIRGLVPID